VSGFRLTIVTPDALTALDDVALLDVPAADGRMTVLPGHQPTVCALSRGAVLLRHAGNGNDRRLIGPGVMTVSRSGVTLITRDATDNLARAIEV
jgi:F-type H+-transporting ATPase subunit epsilon